MSTVDDIQRSISELAPADFARLRDWFAEVDAAAWDRQIEEDAAAGRLDHLIEEAEREHRELKTLEAPTAAGEPTTLEAAKVREAS